jgi:hypothetical protein
VIEAWPKDSRTTWHGGEIDCSHSETAGGISAQGGQTIQAATVQLPLSIASEKQRQLAVRPGWSPILGSRAGPERSWAEPLTGDGQTQFTGTGSANASQSGGAVDLGLLQGEGGVDEVSHGPPPFHNMASITLSFVHRKLSPPPLSAPLSIPSMLALQVCGDGKGLERGQSTPSTPPAAECWPRMLPRQEPRWSPVDDNHAAQACFETDPPQIREAACNDRDEMDDLTGERQKQAVEDMAEPSWPPGWPLGRSCRRVVGRVGLR